MRLREEFYEMLSQQAAEGGFDARIRLLPSSVIFKAHFPGYPITPGAIQLRVATELLSGYLGHPVTLRGISALKFLAPLLPGTEVTYSFRDTSLVVSSGMEVTRSSRVASLVVSSDTEIACSSRVASLVVRSGTEVLSKMNLEYARG